MLLPLLKVFFIFYQIKRLFININDHFKYNSLLVMALDCSQTREFYKSLLYISLYAASVFFNEYSLK